MIEGAGGVEVPKALFYAGVQMHAGVLRAVIY